MSNLTWFLRNIYMSQIVQQDLRNILTKYLFDTMSRFWLMTSFVDVILLYFTNFTTSSPFWTTRLEFYEIFTRNKVVQRDLRNTLKKSFFDTMSCFWLMTSIVTSFCSISSTCLLNRLFERLNLIFTKYLWWVKLFNKMYGTFWQNLCLIECLVFYLWRHFWRPFVLFH